MDYYLFNQLVGVEILGTDEPWGESDNPVVSLTGIFGLTSSVGDGTNMGVPQTGWVGWGGEGEWGAGDQRINRSMMTASVGI